VPDIVLVGIHKSFGDNDVLRDIDLYIPDGHLVTLLGPSGCGKTTTLMSIAGFEQPDRGTIRCGDRTLYDAATRHNVRPERRGIGMVFQSYALWPHLTVAKNIAFPLKIQRLRRDAVRARVGELLEMVELPGVGDRHPHELSGGQRQRVALARALAPRPELLLLDEPFSNLDARLRDRARLWLRNIQQELGITTVFVTHDQDEAFAMSDQLHVMDQGRILQSGTPQAIYRRPVSQFVAGFVGQCNLLSGVVATSPPQRTNAIAVDGLPGPLAADAGARRPGTPVVVAIRPEHVHLSPFETSSNGDAVTFCATVERSTFLGDHYRYELRAGDVSLVAQSPIELTDTQITIRIASADVAIITDEPSSDSKPPSTTSFGEAT
jgi:iron(III) transport system ATP-binding protein